MTELSEDWEPLVEEMFALTRAALANAYVPICDFPVAACLKAEQSRLFVGVNIENAVPGQSVCAETSALGAMIVSGARRLEHILVLGGSEKLKQFCSPCGGCRQRLLEFCDQSTLIHLVRLDGRRFTTPFFNLMPNAENLRTGRSR
jgi:cytidine deaminase